MTQKVSSKGDFLGKLTKLKNYTFEYFQRKHLELQGATREEAQKQAHTRAKKHQTFEPQFKKTPGTPNRKLKPSVKWPDLVNQFENITAPAVTNLSA